MYCVFIVCFLTSFASAAVIPEDAQASIVQYENTNDGSGNYKFSYQTSNGITREETGNLVNVGEENEHMVVKGSFSYTDADGQYVVVRYTADENGYQVNPPELAIQVVSSLPSHAVATLLGK